MSTRRDTYEVTELCGGWVAGQRVSRLPIGANGRPIVELTASQAEHELRTGLIVPYDPTRKAKEGRLTFAPEQPEDAETLELDLDVSVEPIPATDLTMASIPAEIEKQAPALPKLALKGAATAVRGKPKG